MHSKKPDILTQPNKAITASMRTGSGQKLHNKEARALVEPSRQRKRWQTRLGPGECKEAGGTTSSVVNASPSADMNHWPLSSVGGGAGSWSFPPGFWSPEENCSLAGKIWLGLWSRIQQNGVDTAHKDRLGKEDETQSPCLQLLFSLSGPRPPDNRVCGISSCLWKSCSLWEDI